MTITDDQIAAARRQGALAMRVWILAELVKAAAQHADARLTHLANGKREAAKLAANAQQAILSVVPAILALPIDGEAK